MKKRLWWFLPIALIIFLAIGLRFYKLGQIPIELNRDEASLGYTAYSILKTGHEEHGVAWPLSIQSFGDWKLPGYVYTLMPFIKIFGLNNWAVRLPSALAGVGIVILASANVWALTTGGADWKNGRHRYWLALLTGLMMAISPWGIHLSHLAYEANLAMFFFLLGFLSFQVGLKKIEASNSPNLNLSLSSKIPPGIFILFGIFCFGLTLFTYHAYQIFTPVMAIGLLIIYQKQFFSIRQNYPKTFFSGLSLAGFFSVTLILTSLSANKIKFAGLSIFDPKAYRQIEEVNRDFFANRNNILAKLHTNTPILIINQIQRNLADIFSSKFLFFEGGTHGSHDIPSTGKLYPVAFIFLLVAGLKFWQDFAQKKLQTWQKIILLWLAVAAIAPAITFEAAHTIRFSPALFALEFLSAYGLFLLIAGALENKNKVSQIAVMALGAVLAYSTFSFLITYFVISPQRDIDKQNWPMQKIVVYVAKNQDQYDQIIMPGTQWSPYIYFLYYNQTDPATLDQNLEFYPTDQEGFRHVRRLSNIYFEDPDWPIRETAAQQSRKKILYVLKRRDISIDKLESKFYTIEETLADPYAKDEWILLSYEWIPFYE